LIHSVERKKWREEHAMKLIISRHGEAEDLSSSGYDKDRNLTQKGRLDIEKMGRFIQSSPLKVTRIYHSPYIRTQETAEIYSKIFSLPLEPAGCLAPACNCNDLLTDICNFSNSETILVVGHNPDISFFAAGLLRNNSLASMFTFSPGATVAINVAREKFSNGQLIWIISPELLADHF
jgi:phosphohistidine phosphatase